MLALDLHAGQIQGFFNIPVDHLFAAPVMIDYLDEERTCTTRSSSRPTRAASSARGPSPSGSSAGLAIIDKRRDGPNVAVFMHLIGDVKGKDAVIIDDMIDTAGTLVQAADALKREGARRILACGVHAVLSGPGDRAHRGVAPLEEVVVTNSIPLSQDKQLPKITRSLGRARSWRRRSGASTTRNRSRPCSCRRRYAPRRRVESWKCVS